MKSLQNQIQLCEARFAEICHYIWQNGCEFSSGLPSGLTIGRDADSMTKDNYHYNQLKKIMGDRDGEFDLKFYQGFLIDLQLLALLLNQQLLARGPQSPYLYRLTGQAQFVKLCHDLLQQRQHDLLLSEENSITYNQECFYEYQLIVTPLIQQYLAFLQQHQNPDNSQEETKPKVSNLPAQFRAADHLPKWLRYLIPALLVFQNIQAISGLNLTLVRECDSLDVSAIATNATQVTQALACYKEMLGEVKFNQIADEYTIPAEQLVIAFAESFPVHPIKKGEPIFTYAVEEGTEALNRNRRYRDKWAASGHDPFPSLIDQSYEHYPSISAYLNKALSGAPLTAQNDIAVIAMCDKIATDENSQDDSLVETWRYWKKVAKLNLEGPRNYHTLRVLLASLVYQVNPDVAEKYVSQLAHEYALSYNVQYRLVPIKTSREFLHNLIEVALKPFSFHPNLLYNTVRFFYSDNDLVVQTWKSISVNFYNAFPHMLTGNLFKAEQLLLDEPVYPAPTESATRLVRYALLLKEGRYEDIANLFRYAEEHNALIPEDVGFLLHAARASSSRSISYVKAALQALFKYKLYTLLPNNTLTLELYNPAWHFAYSTIKTDFKAMKTTLYMVAQSQGDIRLVAELLLESPSAFKDACSFFGIAPQQFNFEKIQNKKDINPYALSIIDYDIATIYENFISSKAAETPVIFTSILFGNDKEHVQIAAAKSRIHKFANIIKDEETAWVDTGYGLAFKHMAIIRLAHIEILKMKMGFKQDNFSLAEAIENSLKDFKEARQNSTAYYENALAGLENKSLEYSTQYFNDLMKYNLLKNKFKKIEKDYQAILEELAQPTERVLISEEYRPDFLSDEEWRKVTLPTLYDTLKPHLPQGFSKLVQERTTKGIDSSTAEQVNRGVSADNFDWYGWFKPIVQIASTCLVGSIIPYFLLKNFFQNSKKSRAKSRSEKREAAANAAAKLLEARRHEEDSPPPEEQPSQPLSPIEKLKQRIRTEFGMSPIQFEIIESVKQTLPESEEIKTDLELQLNLLSPLSEDEKKFLQAKYNELLKAKPIHLAYLADSNIEVYAKRIAKVHAELVQALQLYQARERAKTYDAIKKQLKKEVQALWDQQADIIYFVALLSNYLETKPVLKQKEEAIKLALELVAKPGQEETQEILYLFHPLFRKYLGGHQSTIVSFLGSKWKKDWHSYMRNKAKDARTETLETDALSTAADLGDYSSDELIEDDDSESVTEEEYAADKLSKAETKRQSNKSEKGKAPCNLASTSTFYRPPTSYAGPVRSASGYTPVGSADTEYLKTLGFLLSTLQEHQDLFGDNLKILDLALQFICMQAAEATNTQEGKNYRNRFAHQYFQFDNPLDVLSSFEFAPIIGINGAKMIKMMNEHLQPHRLNLFDEILVLIGIARQIPWGEIENRARINPEKGKGSASVSNETIKETVYLLALKIQFLRVQSSLSGFDFNYLSLRLTRNQFAHEEKQKAMSIYSESGAVAAGMVVLDNLAHKCVEISTLKAINAVSLRHRGIGLDSVLEDEEKMLAKLFDNKNYQKQQIISRRL